MVTRRSHYFAKWRLYIAYSRFRIPEARIHACEWTRGAAHGSARRWADPRLGARKHSPSTEPCPWSANPRLRVPPAIYARGAATPRLDALARDGVLFERAYAQAPICNPSPSRNRALGRTDPRPSVDSQVYAWIPCGAWIRCRGCGSASQARYRAPDHGEMVIYSRE